MRRAVLTLTGTAAGLAALFSFKTHVPGVTPVAEPSTPAGLSVSAPASSAASSPSASPSKSTKKATAKASSSPSMSPTMTAPTTAPAAVPTTKAAASPTPTPTATKKTSSPTPTPSASTSSAAPSGTFNGPTENTQYGPVQVTIDVSAGKITSANDPDGGDSIATNAISQLNQEVVDDQSANIQAVSGATYTSDGYIQSLQSAVDQAGL